MKNKKVLFVAHVDSHISAFHLPYLKMFKKEGYEVHVASSGEDQFPNCDYKYNIPMQRSPFHYKNVKAYLMLKMIMNKEQFDIIHCHTPVGGVLARMSNLFSRNYNNVKIIYTAHGFHFFNGNSWVRNFLYKTIEQCMARYTDILITINREDYENAKKFRLKNKGEVFLVPGVGIDLKKIQNIDRIDNKELINKDFKDENIKFLLSVGEINENKNHIVVINALQQLPKCYHYIICGVGNKQKDLEILCDQLHVKERVHFLGFRKDVVSIMKGCDFFIFPSKREGLPVSVMEAMACGLVCIVSDVRGNRDLIDNTKGGYTVDLEDLEKRIPEIILNETQNFSQMIAYNHNKIHEYSLDTILVLMKRIYGLE